MAQLIQLFDIDSIYRITRPTFLQNQIIAPRNIRLCLPAGSFAGLGLTLRRAWLWLALVFGIYLSAATGLAAAITWGAPTTININGDADVTNSGSLLYAYTGGAGATVNGVVFTGQTSGTTWGSVSLSGFGSDNQTAFGSGSNISPWSGLSSAYKNVLSGGAYGGASAGTVTLNGLTAGHNYTVQIWANDNRGGGLQTRNETATGGNTVTLAYEVNQSSGGGGVGQFVVGTFLATSTSQSFTLTPSASGSVQLNAINVRDNGVGVFTPTPFTATRVNLAKYQPVITDSTTGTQGGQFITDGLTFNDSYWQSGPSGAHWAQVLFPFPVLVGSVQLAMGRDAASPPTVFWMQYLTNGTWTTISGTTLVSNTNKEVNLVFPTPVTASSFRFYDSIDGNVYIREMALYPPNGPGGYPFGTDFGVDLARKQPVFATTNSTGNYPFLAVDGRISPSSAWQTTLVGSNSLLVNLQFTNKIGSAHLYSGATGVAPLTNFILQYWTAGAWANIPGGSVSGNTNSSLVIPFTTPVTTTKVQLLFTNASVSAVQELCVFSANSNGGYPLGTGVITNTPITANYDTFTDSYYYLSNAVAGLSVVESNGVPVLGQSGKTNLLGQYQMLLSFENGTYRLINHNTGLCLAGAQLTTNVGAQLVDEPYSSLPDQEWYLQSVDGVNYYLVNRFSGLVMDTQAGGATAGTPLVQNVMTNSASQYWQFPLAAIYPKKGSGGPQLSVIQNSSWCYGWWVTTGTVLATNIPFYPMDDSTWFMGPTLAGNLMNFYIPWRTNGQSKILMGYNEPDQTTQGNVDPTNGAIYWHNFYNLDMPLAAPAPASYNNGWLSTFMSYVVTNWGLRVDYVPIHEYPGNNTNASSSIWVNSLQDAYNRWGKPVWMTEFGCVDWGGTGSWSEDNNYNALAEFMWRAESLSYLRKYAVFSFGGPLAPNPWDTTTPAPTSNCFDTNGVMTPYGELYGAWDGDVNVETNKAYYVHNSSTGKHLANTLGSPADAKSIDVRDSCTQWTLMPAPASGQYYLVSAVDGRRVSYNGSSVVLVAPGTTGTSVQWLPTSYQYGWFYLDHPVTSKRLSLAYNNSTFTASYSMVASNTTGTPVQWRFIVPYTPISIVWTGGASASWVSPDNWNSTAANFSVNQRGTYAVTFNSQSTANLATVLNLANNPAVSNCFTVYSLVVSNPAGPVSIGATNLLAIGNGIDLSGASQNLTITAPVFIGLSQPGGRQFWTVTNSRTLTVNSRVDGVADLSLGGGGTVSLGGTNTYTGITTISNNTLLTISGAGQLGGGVYASAITDNGAFNYSSSADQTLSGNISGTGSLTMNGSGTLTLSGTNIYSGNTTVSNGATLALSGSGSLASPYLILAGGAMLDVSGETATFALGSGSTLTNSSVGALISGNINCSVGNLSLVADGANPAFIQTNGTMTISATTVVVVNNIGATLTPGTYPLIAAATAGNPGNVTGTVPSVIVTGNGATTVASLQIDGSGSLNLVIGGNIQTWTGANSSSWTTAGNWVSGITPGSGSNVLFNSSSTANLATVLNANFNLGSLTVLNPAGPVSIGGANTLAITNGINLAFASQNLSITAPVVLGGSQSWTVTNTLSLSASGGVSGSAGLTVNGGGTVSLGGTNTYTGSTTINAGALTISGAGQLGGGNYATNIANSGALNYNSTASQTVSGVISGTGPLTVSGPGILTLAGANTYSGATTISGGALTIGGVGQLGGGTYATAITDNGTLIYNSSANQTFSGIISGTGALNDLGPGTLTLSATNTYSGGTTIANGTIPLVNSYEFGTGAVMVNSNGAAYNYSATVVTISNAVTLNGGGFHTGGGNGGTRNVWAGPVTLTASSYVQSDGTTTGNAFTGGLNLGNSNYTLTVGGNGNNSGSANNFNSVISGGPSATFLTSSSGLAYLNAANTFSGSVRSGWSLVLQNVNALQSATLDMNTNDSGTITLVNNAVIGALVGSRNLNLNANSISIGNNGSNTTYSGELTGSGSMTKIGVGTLTLSGANSNTGSTMINAGVLALTGSGSLASTNIIVAGGTMLDVSGRTTPFVLGVSTLMNSSVGAVLGGTNNCSVGTLSMVVDGANPAFIQTNGTMTLSAGTVIKVNNTGAILAAGTHPLIAAATTGNPGKVTGALPSVVVTGNGASGAVSLQTNASFGVDLVVAGSPVSSDATLTYLALSPGVLSPIFSSGTTNYTATNIYANSAVTVTVTNNSSSATNVLYLNGVAQGTNPGSLTVPSLPLAVGSSNVVWVQVTAQDGLTVSNYVVNVTRLGSTNALLANLVLTPAGMLSPAFGSNLMSYTATNTYPTNGVTVTATSGDGTAQMALSFNHGSTYNLPLTNGVASGTNTLSLSAPANLLAVQVVSQDLSQTNVYLVTELLQPSPAPALITNSVSGNTLTLTWPGDHLGWIAQSNSVNLGNTNYWFDILGSQSATNLLIPMNPAAPQVYYRLRYPF